jgi:hypothetical protein
MSKPIKIIQVSVPRTGSTVLYNVLLGLFEKKDKEFIGIDKYNFLNNIHEKDENFIFKSHDLNIDTFIKKYGNKYDLYFISTERDNKTIDKKFHNYKNVIIINYNNLLETKENTIENIVHNIFNNIKHLFEGRLNYSIENAVTRIKEMNLYYETIKDKPFTFHDNIYSIHGHHRTKKY